MKKSVQFPVFSAIIVSLFFLFSSCARSQWHRALNADSLETYVRFANTKACSKYAQLARQLLEHKYAEQAWQRIRKSSRAADFEHFLINYPQSKYTVEAKRILQGLYQRERRGDLDAPREKSIDFNDGHIY